MSMISAQCDELRELATRYDELQDGAVKAVTMPSDMGSILRNAADTIWELRGSVHRERAEADRLRELAQRADRLLTSLFPYIDYSRCTALEAVAAWRVRARELGVEVDG